MEYEKDEKVAKVFLSFFQSFSKTQKSAVAAAEHKNLG